MNLYIKNNFKNKSYYIAEQVKPKKNTAMKRNIPCMYRSQG